MFTRCAAQGQADRSSRASEALELMVLFEDAKRSGSVVQVEPIDSWHWPTCVCGDCNLSRPATPCGCPDTPTCSLSRTASSVFSRTVSSVLSDDGSPPALQRRRRSQRESVCKISDEAAATIFLAARCCDKPHAPRDGLSSKLAKEYGITTKAVRDIWNRRTWRHATKPHWGPEDFETKNSPQEKPCKPKPRKVVKGTQQIENNCDWLIDPTFIAAEFHGMLMEWDTCPQPADVKAGDSGAGALSEMSVDNNNDAANDALAEIFGVGPTATLAEVDLDLTLGPVFDLLGRTAAEGCSPTSPRATRVPSHNEEVGLEGSVWGVEGGLWGLEEGGVWGLEGGVWGHEGIV